MAWSSSAILALRYGSGTSRQATGCGRRARPVRSRYESAGCTGQSSGQNGGARETKGLIPLPSATEELTTALAAGDEDAVETFYQRYFDWLYGQARRATRRDESFCLDVVQDAMLRIIRTIRAVEDDTRFRAWLRLVVQSTAWDRMRSETRRHQR